MQVRHLSCALIAGLALSGAAQAIDLTYAGYQQNFDAMGQNGTTLPAGWSMWMSPGNASTFTNFISPSEIDRMVPLGTSLTAIGAPTGATSTGFNAANLAPAATTDRVLATSPGSGAAVAIQLSLTNATTVDLSGVVISFDIVRYSAAPVANELSGYTLLTTIDGISSAYTRDLLVVPNSAGTTQIMNLTLAPGFTWAPGRTMLIWWFDDNAQQSSPNQIIGLNNVVITPTPEPASALLLAAGIGVVGLALRRR